MRGVQYEHGDELRTAEAAAEVVLCAGAVGSPHLPKLSGIGLADATRACALAMGNMTMIVSDEFIKAPAQTAAGEGQGICQREEMKG